MKLVKTHAFGNDFLLLREADVPAGADRPALARQWCARHSGPTGVSHAVLNKTRDAG